jgi:hypothetical protein
MGRGNVLHRGLPVVFILCLLARTAMAGSVVFQPKEPEGRWTEKAVPRSSISLDTLPSRYEKEEISVGRTHAKPGRTAAPPKLWGVHRETEAHRLSVSWTSDTLYYPSPDTIPITLAKSAPAITTETIDVRIPEMSLGRRPQSTLSVYPLITKVP